MTNSVYLSMIYCLQTERERTIDKMDRINAIAIAHEISQNKYRLLGQISVTESQYTELLNALRM